MGVSPVDAAKRVDLTTQRQRSAAFAACMRGSMSSVRRGDFLFRTKLAPSIHVARYRTGPRSASATCSGLRHWPSRFDDRRAPCLGARAHPRAPSGCASDRWQAAGWRWCGCCAARILVNDHAAEEGFTVLARPCRLGAAALNEVDGRLSVRSARRLGQGPQSCSIAIQRERTENWNR